MDIQKPVSWDFQILFRDYPPISRDNADIGIQFFESLKIIIASNVSGNRAKARGSPIRGMPSFDQGLENRLREIRSAKKN